MSSPREPSANAPLPALSQDAAALLHALPGLTLVAETAGGAIVAASAEAEAEFGCTSENRIRLADLAGTGPAMRLLAARQGSVVVRTDARKADGSQVPLELASRSLPSTHGLILISANTPSREDALVDYIAGNQWFETCAALAGGLAHSFNNSLAAILGLSEIISLKLPEDSPVAQFPPKIGTAIEKARSLVMRLSQMSRKAPGQPQAEATAMILDELRPVMQAFLPANAIFEAVIDENTPWCHVDRQAFEHIVLNCIGFARGRMRRSGGSVRLESGPGNPPDTAQVTITCGGPELSGLDAERLFELDLSPTETAYESGTALFVAKRLAEANGATLTAQASADAITFQLALAPAPEPED